MSPKTHHTQGDHLWLARSRPIPKELLVDEKGQAADRAALQRWINGLWEEKDAEIAQIKAGLKSS